MKSTTLLPSHRNNRWKIPAGLLAAGMIFAGTANAQTSCACSTTKGAPAKAGAAAAASCCDSTTAAQGAKTAGSSCSCSSTQAQGKQARPATRVQGAQTPQGRQAAQGEAGNAARKSRRPDYAQKADAALRQGELPAAEKVLREHYTQARSEAEESQVKTGVAMGLVNLAMGLRKLEEHGTRKEAMERAVALMDEVIEGTEGREKATAMMTKAQMLKLIFGGGAGINKLVEQARALDPENPALLRHLGQNAQDRAKEKS